MRRTRAQRRCYPPRKRPSCSSSNNASPGSSLAMIATACSYRPLHCPSRLLNQDVQVQAWTQMTPQRLLNTPQRHCDSLCSRAQAACGMFRQLMKSTLKHCWRQKQRRRRLPPRSSSSSSSSARHLLPPLLHNRVSAPSSMQYQAGATSLNCWVRTSSCAASCFLSAPLATHRPKNSRRGCRRRRRRWRSSKRDTRRRWSAPCRKPLIPKVG